MREGLGLGEAARAIALGLAGRAIGLGLLGALAFAPTLTAAPGVSVAPRFQARDLEGRSLDLGVLRHRGPVLLEFWATWCKPCHASLSEIQALHQELGPRGLTVIGISIDGPRNYTKVRPFANSMGLTFPIVIDQDGRLQHLYQVIAVPTSVLVDSSGQVAQVRMGFRPGEGRKLKQRILALLPRAPAGGAEDASGGDAPPDSTADRPSKP